MMFVQDLGSTFGKNVFLVRESRAVTSRTEQSQTVFKKAEKCELRNCLAGGKQPLKEAQDLLKQRIALARSRSRARDLPGRAVRRDGPGAVDAPARQRGG